MAYNQSSFLLDYRAFREAAAPLMAALDAGNPAPLQVRAAQVSRAIGSPKDWILHDKGTFLGDVSAKSDPRYRNSQWGHWFLIVLSEFLRPTVSLGYDWMKLSRTLHYFGWDQEASRRVFAGLPTVWLLKPDAPYHQGMFITWETPYWYWLGFDRSIHDGWLPVEEIPRLRQRLQAEQPLVERELRTRVVLPPEVSVERAHLSPLFDPDYWYARIPIVYRQAIEMMDQALKANVGLFMVVYQEEDDLEVEESAADDGNPVY